jgi:hypothetical protein
MMSNNNVLYWSGTMLDSDPTVGPQIQQTNQSGITTVLLWSLHVVAANTSKNTVLGDLVWNDTVLVSSYTGTPVFDPGKNFTTLSGSLKNLLKSGSSVTQLFFSIGSAAWPPGSQGDFDRIQTLLSTTAGQTTLTNNFSCLLQNLPMITGFDFDDEDNFDVDTVAGLTELLVTNFNSVITYCPFGDWNISFWESCLETVYSKMGKQPVAWYNLQCYSGGDGSDPLAWVTDINTNKSKNGVADANAFVIPGYAAMNNQNDGGSGMLCPPDFCKSFMKYKGKVPGGFIWNSQHVFDNGTNMCDNKTATIDQYVDAINNGLSGNCP